MHLSVCQSAQNTLPVFPLANSLVLGPFAFLDNLRLQISSLASCSNSVSARKDTVFRKTYRGGPSEHLEDIGLARAITIS